MSFVTSPPVLSSPPIGLAAVEAFYSPVAGQLTEFPVICGGLSFGVTAHRKAAPNIAAFFAIASARGLGHLIKSWDGCYVDRPKRMSSQLSMHGRGAAFDINASTNNQGDAHGNMPQVLVDIARSVGFFWGGDFKGEYVDRMHFQLGTDFALNGRPAPRVTWHGELPAVIPTALHVPPVPAPVVHLTDVQSLTADGVKVFGADGTLLFSHLAGPVRAGVDGDRLIVRLP